MPTPIDSKAPLVTGSGTGLEPVRQRREAEVRAPTSGEAGLFDLVVNEFSRRV